MRGRLRGRLRARLPGREPAGGTRARWQLPADARWSPAQPAPHPARRRHPKQAVARAAGVGEQTALGCRSIILNGPRCMRQGDEEILGIRRTSSFVQPSGTADGDQGRPTVMVHSELTRQCPRLIVPVSVAEETKVRTLRERSTMRLPETSANLAASTSNGMLSIAANGMLVTAAQR